TAPFSQRPHDRQGDETDNQRRLLPRLSHEHLKSRRFAQAKPCLPALLSRHSTVRRNERQQAHDLVAIAEFGRPDETIFFVQLTFAAWFAVLPLRQPLGDRLAVRAKRQPGNLTRLENRRLGRVVTAAQLAADRSPAKENHDPADRRAFRKRIDPGHLDNFDFEAGFLFGFTNGRFFGALVRFDETARQRPFALVWRVRPPDEHDTAVLFDQQTNGGNRIVVMYVTTVRAGLPQPPAFLARSQPVPANRAIR